MLVHCTLEGCSPAAQTPRHGGSPPDRAAPVAGSTVVVMSVFVVGSYVWVVCALGSAPTVVLLVVPLASDDIMEDWVRVPGAVGTKVGPPASPGWPPVIAPIMPWRHVTAPVKCCRAACTVGGMACMHAGC